MIELILVAALNVQTLSTDDLKSYYWDCDTAFMKGELGGNDLNSCLSITDELQSRVFNNDKSLFIRWWKTYNLPEWYKRGFIPKIEQLPELRY